jgi:hypothetical protein
MRQTLSRTNVQMQAEQVPSWAETTPAENEKLRAKAESFLDQLGGFGPETGVGAWDPFGLATETATGIDIENRLRWYRQAEIKHGRVCMAAFVGWLVSLNGGVFPWLKESVGANPLETWSNTPLEYQLGFVLSCGLIEWRTLNGKWAFNAANDEPGSLTRPGAKLGVATVPFGWDPIGLMSKYKTAEQRAVSLESELKNGRLAMIGVASLYFSTAIPDSVPFLSSKFDWASVLG